MSTETPNSTPYVALARRYRPRQFADFVGLEHVTRTLQNSIKNNRIGHAYLFCGPRGIGKTSMVRVFATALNCENGPAIEPCGKCESCTATRRGDGIDVIEIDGASHTGVDDVRELREHALYSPAKSRFKIFVIDEVHMLSKSAFNALLKILEEPPAHVKFMFATTEPQKVPETIQSRCQRFDFPRVSAAAIAEMLKRICKQEGVNAPEQALAHIARNVRGGLRDSLSILDQLIAYDGNDIQADSVYKVMGSVPEGIIAELGIAIISTDIGSALRIVEDAINKGKEGAEFIEAIANFFRDVLFMRNCGADFNGFVTGPAARDAVKTAAGRLDDDTLIYVQQVLMDLRGKMRQATNPSLLIETAVVRLCRWRDFAAFGALLSNYQPQDETEPKQTEQLKKKVIADAPLPTPAPHTDPAPEEDYSYEPEPEAQTDHTDDTPSLLPQRDEIPAEVYAPAPAITTGTIDEAAWKKAVHQVCRIRGFLGATLDAAHFLGLASDEITLGFPPALRFQREQLDDRAKRVEAEEKLSEIFGKNVTLNIIDIELDKAGAQAQDTAKDLDPIVTKTLNIFSGKIIEPQEQTRNN